MKTAKLTSVLARTKLSSFVVAGGWKKTSALPLIGWKGVGILFLLCVATALPSPAQTLTTLLNFDGSNGGNPTMSVIQGTDGNLYGTTESGDTIFKMTPSGVLTTLNTLNDADGLDPSGLVQATDGNFYGTTQTGGAYIYGTIFKITPKGSLTVLYNFCAKQNCEDGSQPVAALIQGSDRNLYGTTQGGGANNWGTVFKISLSGKLTTLYSFCAQSNCADGSEPIGQLVQATDGNFYGTTDEEGVISQACSSGCGTVFKITPKGVLTTIHSFDGTDGNLIVAGLIQVSTETSTEQPYRAVPTTMARSSKLHWQACSRLCTALTTRTVPTCTLV
jgi:uncharacterized repeat protein (TIGR03803 family)